MLIGGRYHFESKLGAGGMGEVWLARDRNLDRAVAVKRLLPDPFLPSSYRQRFDAEYRLMLTLQHEHVVQLLDRVEEGGQQYLVMELVEGPNLEVLVHEGGLPLSAPVAAYIADCILDALDFMQTLVLGGQRANIVHRDITPQNILLSFAGAVLVSDFGVAKLKASWKESTEVPLFIGKRSYAPPEMYETGYVDHRMDLYAVGVLLYEMLSGRRAFPIDDPLKSRDRICRGELAPLQALAPAVSADLAAVVAQLMHRDPQARFQTAQAAREALLTAVPKAQLAKAQLRELIQQRYGGPRRPTGLHFSVESYEAAVRAKSASDGLVAAEAARDAAPRIAAEAPTLPVSSTPPGITTLLAAPSGAGELVSSGGVPQLVPEPEGKWAADPARPSSSPWLTRPSSRERLVEGEATERSSRSRPDRRLQAWVAGIGVGILGGALCAVFVLRSPAVEREVAGETAAPTEPAAPSAPLERSEPAARTERAVPADPTVAPAARLPLEAVGLESLVRPAATVAPRGRARAAPAAMEKGFGELEIDSTRPAAVLLDGVSLGRTPIRGYSLSPGRYELELVDLVTGARQQQSLLMTLGRVHLRL